MGKLTFFSDSADGMSDCSKTLDVKKGEIYWITDRFVKGKKELVVVNKKKLHQLSQTLQKDLKQKFKGSFIFPEKWIAGLTELVIRAFLHSF